jgi:hypothetical protein
MCITPHQPMVSNINEWQERLAYVDVPTTTVDSFSSAVDHHYLCRRRRCRNHAPLCTASLRLDRTGSLYIDTSTSPWIMFLFSVTIHLYYDNHTKSFYSFMLISRDTRQELLSQE